LVPLLSLWLQAGAGAPSALSPGDERRLDSLGALARTDPAARQALLAAIRSGEDEVAPYAAVQLAQAGPQALSLLTAALRDADPRVGRLAAYGIGELGPRGRRAVPQLVAAVAGADDSVAAMANWAITRVSPRAGGNLLASLRDLRFGEPGDRAEAVIRLGMMPEGGSIALPALLQSLGDRDEGVAQLAAATLRRLGWLVLHPLQATLLTGEPRVRPRALILITRLRGGVF
jgi:HEAT repeat protein